MFDQESGLQCHMKWMHAVRSTPHTIPTPQPLTPRSKRRHVEESVFGKPQKAPRVMRTYERRSTLTCPYCNATFSGHDKLVEHMDKRHTPHNDTDRQIKPTRLLESRKNSVDSKEPSPVEDVLKGVGSLVPYDSAQSDSESEMPPQALTVDADLPHNSPVRTRSHHRSLASPLSVKDVEEYMHNNARESRADHDRMSEQSQESTQSSHQSLQPENVTLSKSTQERRRPSKHGQDARQVSKTSHDRSSKNQMESSQETTRSSRSRRDSVASSSNHTRRERSDETRSRSHRSRSRSRRGERSRSPRRRAQNDKERTRRSQHDSRSETKDQVRVTEQDTRTRAHDTRVQLRSSDRRNLRSSTQKGRK